MTQPPSGAQTSPQPRMSEDDRIARLQLLRSPRVGPATYSRLIAAHGTAAEALKALPDLARSKGVKSYQLVASIWRSANISPARKLARISFFSMKPAIRASWLKSPMPRPSFGFWDNTSSSRVPAWPLWARAMPHPWARAWPIVWPQVLQKPA